MTSPQDLVTEVRQALADARTAGPVNGRWLHQATVSEHVRMGHVGSDWALCCAHQAIKAVISKLLHEFKACEDEPELKDQMVLPGWNRLQRDYLVRRDGEGWILSLTGTRTPRSCRRRANTGSRDSAATSTRRNSSASASWAGPGPLSGPSYHF